MRQSGEIQSVSAISYRVKKSYEVQIEECLGVETLAVVIINFDSDCIEEYASLVATHDQGDIRFKPKLELDMNHRDSPPVILSIEKAPKVELKALPPYLRYIFLGKCYMLPVNIVSDLNVHQLESLVEVLKRFKRAIRWTIGTLLGYLPGFVHIKSNSCAIISRVLRTRDV